MSVVVRPLALSDLADLLAVQLACYGEGFVESGEVFARRLASPANCSLVLVQGSQAYWQRQGYALHPLQDAAQQARLASYGEGAVYMARTL